MINLGSVGNPYSNLFPKINNFVLGKYFLIYFDPKAQFILVSILQNQRRVQKGGVSTFLVKLGKWIQRKTAYNPLIHLFTIAKESNKKISHTPLNQIIKYGAMLII